MSLTQEQIARLGKLTSLKINKDPSVDSVLDSFSTLSDTDTSTILSVSRSGNATLSPRPDIQQDSHMSGALLACSAQKKAAHQIVL